MALLGSLLPGILSTVNPTNLVKGVLNTGSGILENISKGKISNIGENLSKGLKSILASPADISALGSIGGQNNAEPTIQEKILGSRNAANISSIERINKIARDLRPSMERNAANHHGVYSEDRTRTGVTGGAPVNELISTSESVESAPAGMPDRRIALVHTNRKKVPAMDLLNARDQYGYKSIPVEMTGVRSKSKIEEAPVRVPKFRVAKQKQKKR